MDSHAWRRVYSTVRSVDRSVPRTGRSKRFSNVLIVGIYLWSVWHDRPLCWACDRIHYGSLLSPATVAFRFAVLHTDQEWALSADSREGV